MKIAIFVLLLAAGVLPSQSIAQTASSCAACVGAAACETRHGSCASECRARYFSIDPKRAACVADCTTGSAKCMQITTNECRTRAMCR